MLRMETQITDERQEIDQCHSTPVPSPVIGNSPDLKDVGVTKGSVKGTLGRWEKATFGRVLP